MSETLFYHSNSLIPLLKNGRRRIITSNFSAVRRGYDPSLQRENINVIDCLVKGEFVLNEVCIKFIHCRCIAMNCFLYLGSDKTVTGKILGAHLRPFQELVDLPLVCPCNNHQGVEGAMFQIRPVLIIDNAECNQNWQEYKNNP